MRIQHNPGEAPRDELLRHTLDSMIDVSLSAIFGMVHAEGIMESNLVSLADKTRAAYEARGFEQDLEAIRMSFAYINNDLDLDDSY